MLDDQNFKSDFDSALNSVGIKTNDVAISIPQVNTPKCHCEIFAVYDIVYDNPNLMFDVLWGMKMTGLNSAE